MIFQSLRKCFPPSDAIRNLCIFLIILCLLLNNNILNSWGSRPMQIKILSKNNPERSAGSETNEVLHKILDDFKIKNKSYTHISPAQTLPSYISLQSSKGNASKEDTYSGVLDKLESMVAQADNHFSADNQSHNLSLKAKRLSYYPFSALQIKSDDYRELLASNVSSDGADSRSDAPSTSFEGNSEAAESTTEAGEKVGERIGQKYGNEDKVQPSTSAGEASPFPESSDSNPAVQSEISNDSASGQVSEPHVEGEPNVPDRIDSKLLGNISAQNAEKSKARPPPDFQITEQGNSIDSQFSVLVEYNFPVETEQSTGIAFIVLALPPGYVASKEKELCFSDDPVMPKLSCTSKDASISSASASVSTFVTITSEDKSHSLPLGDHKFGIKVHSPVKSLDVGKPENWWFATFRFTGGHAITRHWENRKLIDQRACIWGQWTQDTPCSTTCGDGFEIWSRSLYAGPNEDECGGSIIKRPCRTEVCSLNCHLGPWETVIDCTKSCGAAKGESFQVKIRKPIFIERGWGKSCRTMYAWDIEANEGWSDEVQAVISLKPCEGKFQEPCPEELGCRVEPANTTNIPTAYPWGVCPFPCGGFGTITSVVQVANGIPRWLGESQFPDKFQIPCVADKQPLVTQEKCNMGECEDCSVYIENPIFERATRAWIFFLPSQEADVLEVTVPKNVSIVSIPDQKQPGDARVNTQKVSTEEKLKVSPLSDLLPNAISKLREIQNPVDDWNEQQHNDAISYRDALGNCKSMPTSFGEVETCNISISKHYAEAQAATIKLKEIIEPSISPVENGDKKKQRGRPQWFALPIVLGEKEHMQDSGNFYLWLTRSQWPRDPEIFKCHLKTQLNLPSKCKFEYRPQNVADCSECSSESKTKIKAYRRFVPASNGGSCEIPQDHQVAEEVLVKTFCAKGCSHINQQKTIPKGRPEHLAPSRLVPISRVDKSINPDSNSDLTRDRMLISSLFNRKTIQTDETSLPTVTEKSKSIQPHERNASENGVDTGQLDASTPTNTEISGLSKKT